MEVKQRERILIFAAIICLALLAGDKLILSPLSDLWIERSERISELKDLLRDGDFLVKREDVIKGRWDQMNSISLPQNMTEAENRILNSLNRWTQDSRINITSVKPRWAENDEAFMKLEFHASGNGNLASITRFLYELETDKEPLKVEELDITSRDESGNNLSLDLRFSGLVLLSEK